MNIFILHRDLRLIDSTALIHQIKEMGSTTVIFILTPEQVGKNNNYYYNSNSIQFMCESLHDLSNEIKKYGGKLYFFKGETIKVLKSIHKNIPIKSIAYNLDYSVYSKQRDQEIRDWCQTTTIKCFEKEDYLLHDILDGDTNKEDGTYYKVFSPFRNHCKQKLQVRKPDPFKKFILDKHTKLESITYYINESEIDKLYTFNPTIAVNGGRENALNILKNLKKWNKYNEKKDCFSYETTKLSPHNHFTTISIRELYWSVIDKLGFKNQIINELYWRDFFSNISHNNPQMLIHQIKEHVKNKTFKEKYNHINWKYNKKIFDGWATGNIGIPLVDACMRELIQTGYMSGRGRMLVSSIITKNCLQDWTEAEAVFARHLVDYSCMMNIGNWCWQIGGLDPKQYLRIFNPYIQSKKFDPKALYIKKWIPELELVSDKDIHNWDTKWEENLKNGIKYIKPLIDYKKSRDEGMKELRRINKLNNI